MYRHASASPSALSPMFLRSTVGAAPAVAGLCIAPDIPVKKLQGAMSFAPVAPDEQPLALVDTSILQSGKSGLLLTDRAVYLDSPRVRVPLALLTQPPVGKSASTVPHVATPMGTVTLPTSATDESLAAMLAVLRAVAWAQRGATRFAVGPTPTQGPVGELAAHTLRHPELMPAPLTLPARVHAASNVAHAWLDHDTGETLLCLLDETVSLDGTRGLALTDRRLIAFGDKPVEVPFAALTGFSLRRSMLSAGLQIATTQGALQVDTSAREDLVRGVAEFLSGLGGIAPQHRHAAWSVAGSAEDPSGALGVMRALTQPELRAATLLELSHAAVTAGALSPAAGFDLTQRAARLHACLRGGHGRTGVMQRSPLSAADLVAVFVQLLGAPAWTGFEANGQVLDFELGRGGSAAGTIASNVVGIALLAVVGVGWVSTGGGGPQRVRLRVWEAPYGSGFTLCDPAGAPLARSNAKLAAVVLRSVAELGALALLRRTVNGWSAPLEALSTEPVGALDARVKALCPTADSAVFLMQ